MRPHAPPPAHRITRYRLAKEIEGKQGEDAIEIVFARST
jgi:hypothetical protein